MLKIVLLGGGNVAHHLFTQFSKNPKVELIQWYNRRGSSIEKFEQHTEITTRLDTLKEADVYIIAVSDNAIAELSTALPFQDKLVVHTSGNTPLQNIDSKNRAGVFYPLQSFKKDKMVDWSKVPLPTEASTENDLDFLLELAKSMSENVYKINSQQRSAMLLAAVFVNNF